MKVQDIACLYNPIHHQSKCDNRSSDYFKTSIIIVPYPIKPTTGEHDYRTCEVCQNNRRIITDSLIEKENKFPFCCEYHKNLIGIKGFNASLYKGAATMCADKVIFTYQHILNYQNHEDWHTPIRQYLNYVIDSFGLFPKGFGEPLFLSFYIKYVEELINNNSGIKDEVKKYIKSYFEQLNKPKEKQDPIKLLLDAYNKWLKLFPFSISFFKELREEYANMSPLILTGYEINPFSSVVKFNLITPEELSAILCRITEKLFEDISTKIANELSSNIF